MTTLEDQAKQLIKRHLPLDVPAYQELTQSRYTGFMEYYLQYSRSYQTLSTFAFYDLTMKLAQIDQQRDNKTIF